MQHVNLMICSPGHSMMSSYVKSLLATFQYLSDKGITVGWSSEYASHVADAREATLAGSKQNIIEETRPFHGNLTYDKLMWIDSDINWNPEDVLKLYESDKDIISGAYLLGNGEVVAYPEMLKNGYSIDDVINKTEPEKIAAAGFGFICIKQGIFEQMSRPWFQQVMISTERNGEIFTFPLLGEDLSWCERARQLGYDIWLDPTVRVIHNKTMKLTWEGPRP